MKKTTLFALIVFVGLAVGAVLTLQKKPERGITRVSFAQVDLAQVDRLVVGGPNAVELVRKDGKWTLAGRPADESAVKAALEAVQKIDTTDLVTRNKDRFAELEVDEAKGARVEAFASGKRVAELVVGKWASGGAYVRVDDAVYSARGLAPGVLSRPRAGWHVLTVFADPVEDVERLELTLGGQPPYALVKKDGAWALEDPKLAPAGFRLDGAAVSSMASALARLTAQELFEQDPGLAETKLDDKADAVAFVLKGGTRRELRLGAKDSKGTVVYAKASDKPDVYGLGEWIAKSVRKTVADLRDLGLMRLEREKVQRLEIVEGKKRLVFEKAKDGGDWTLATSSEKAPEGFELDSAMVERRIGMLASARAVRLANRASGPVLLRATVTAHLEGGAKAVLSFGGETKVEGQDFVFAMGNVDDDTYLVAKSLSGQLLGGLETFKKRAGGMPGGMPGGLNPAALNQLPPEVREQLLRQLQGK